MSTCREIPLKNSFYSALPQMGVLRISGPDARRFLQGQITQDVQSLAVGASALAACCNAQGRVRALFQVLAVADSELLLLMPAILIPGLIEALKKYAVFFKVQISDASAQWQLTGVKHDCVDAPAEGYTLSIAEGLHLVLHPAGQDYAPAGMPCLSPAHWDAAEILAGLPQIAPETVEKFLPHSLNLPALGGVSFKKGCYTGQEIVARMEYRGKLKTEVHSARCAYAGAIAPGTEVQAGEQSVGELIRASLLDDGVHPPCTLILASIRSEALSLNCHLLVDGLPILEWLI